MSNGKTKTTHKTSSTQPGDELAMLLKDGHVDVADYLHQAHDALMASNKALTHTPDDRLTACFVYRILLQTLDELAQA